VLEVARNFHDLYKKLIFSLPNVTPTFSEIEGNNELYVERKELVKSILDIYEDKSDGDYYIIVGPKGSGKSTLISQTFKGKKGVVNILINQHDTDTSIITKLIRFCNIEYEGNMKSIEPHQFQEVFISAKKQMKGKQIMIIFEVERSKGSNDVLNFIKLLAKEFALNANVIIVLSEANAALDYGIIK